MSTPATAHFQIHKNPFIDQSHRGRILSYVTGCFRSFARLLATLPTQVGELDTLTSEAEPPCGIVTCQLPPRYVNASLAVHRIVVFNRSLATNPHDMSTIQIHQESRHKPPRYVNNSDSPGVSYTPVSPWPYLPVCEQVGCTGR